MIEGKPKDDTLYKVVIDMINAFHGLGLSEDDIMALGRSVLKNERDFNKAAGFTPGHDRFSGFFKNEKLTPHGVVFNVTDEDLDSVFNW